MAKQIEKNMQKEHVNAAATAASVNAQNVPAKGATKQAQVSTCAYIERMQINKHLCTASPKIAYKVARENSLIPSELFDLACESVAYRDYIAYMKERHNIAADDKTSAPARGWSVWYALQWAEKQVKAAANDATHPAHTKAVAYLRKTRAQMQDAATKRAC